MDVNQQTYCECLLGDKLKYLSICRHSCVRRMTLNKSFLSEKLNVNVYVIQLPQNHTVHFCHYRFMLQLPAMPAEAAVTQIICCVPLKLASFSRYDGKNTHWQRILSYTCLLNQHIPLSVAHCGEKIVQSGRGHLILAPSV